METDQESPLKTFHIEQYRSDDSLVVWLVDRRQKTPRSFRLLEPKGVEWQAYAPSISLSPDECWILVETKLCHGQNAANLYRRGEGLRYAEIAPSSFSDQAWDFFRKQGSLQKNFAEEYHFIIRCGNWMPNSHSLLVSLSGNDGNIRVDDWKCYYDLQKRQFYIDETLAAKNRHAVDAVEAKGRRIL